MPGPVPSLGLSGWVILHNAEPRWVDSKLACTPRLCVCAHRHIYINAYTLRTENCLIWSFFLHNFLSCLDYQPLLA